MIIKERYQVTRSLSEFELGTTYEAFDILRQQTVIVKKYTSSFFDLRFFNRLQNAVDAIGQLNHPHMVPLLDSLWERSAFYLINEAHNKQTLAEILSHIKSFSVEQTLPIVRPVAKVLEYVHQKGLYHGTLNDENVLILKDGSIKVKNFLIEDLISQFCLKKGVLITKASYLAPEQLRSEKTFPQSDVFALGALIYQMLTGTTAFAGQNESIRFHKNLTSQPIPPSLIEKNIPEAVEKMILRALAKNPYERYETPLELLRDFEMQSYTTPLFVRPYEEERPQDIPHDKLEDPMKFDQFFDEKKPPRTWIKPLEPHLKKVLENKKVSQITENVVEQVETTLHKMDRFINDEKPLPRYRAPKSTKEIFLILVTLGIVLGVGFTATAGFIKIYFTSIPAVEVPDLKGLPLADGVEILEKQGLKFKISGESTNAEVPPEHILAQEPRPGKIVKKNRRVKLIISKGIGDAMIPSLVGKSLSQVTPILKNAGLKLVVEKQIYSTDVPYGEIINQNPAAGVSVGQGTTINIQVSAGYPAWITLRDESDTQKVIDVTISIPEDWLPQKVKVISLVKGETRTLLNKEIFPKNKISQTFIEDRNAVIEIYFGDNLANKQELSNMSKPKAAEPTPTPGGPENNPTPETPQ